MSVTKQTKYEIIIGLKDKNTYKQMLSTEKFVKIVKSVCKRKYIGYSMHVMEGGYIHRNGTYINEKSLNITFYYITKKQVLEIASILKKLFNQESVIVITTGIESYLIA